MKRTSGILAIMAALLSISIPTFAADTIKADKTEKITIEKTKTTVATSAMKFKVIQLKAGAGLDAALTAKLQKQLNTIAADKGLIDATSPDTLNVTAVWQDGASRALVLTPENIYKFTTTSPTGTVALADKDLVDASRKFILDYENTATAPPLRTPTKQQ
jgi:NAD(P)H-hydrate repair Nnr-like enzyme with NAD(P)H-hydrate dehydratase domain